MSEKNTIMAALAKHQEKYYPHLDSYDDLVSVESFITKSQLRDVVDNYNEHNREGAD